MERLRVVVIVSKDESDIFFANRLLQSVNVIAVIVENQHDDRPFLSKLASHLVRPHVLVTKLYNRILYERDKKYAEFYLPENACNFGGQGDQVNAPDGTALLYTTGANRINDKEYIERLQELQPDVVAVCGSSLLQEEILSVPKLGSLNLHGGLSQRYRGLYTTDWAVFNQEPECVGATVHYIAGGIDDGDILYQGRPQIDIEDTPHSLYEKVVKFGVCMMIQAIEDLEAGTSRSEPLSKLGDLYLGKSYTNKVRSQTWKTLRGGVLERYLKEKEQRDEPVLASMQCKHPDSH
ncbi:MAG: formyl transferase [Pseudomonadota bacterium]